MRTYHAFYNQKKIELQAESSYAAQEAAARLFKVKPKYSYRVAVVVADSPVHPASL